MPQTTPSTVFNPTEKPCPGRGAGEQAPLRVPNVRTAATAPSAPSSPADNAGGVVRGRAAAPTPATAGPLPQGGFPLREAAPPTARASPCPPAAGPTHRPADRESLGLKCRLVEEALPRRAPAGPPTAAGLRAARLNTGAERGPPGGAGVRLSPRQRRRVSVAEPPPPAPRPAASARRQPDRRGTARLRSAPVRSGSGPPTGRGCCASAAGAGPAALAAGSSRARCSSCQRCSGRRRWWRSTWTRRS